MLCKVKHDANFWIRYNGAIHGSDFRLLLFVMSRSALYLDNDEAVIQVSDRDLAYALRYEGERRGWIIPVKKVIGRAKDICLISYEGNECGKTFPVFDMVAYSADEQACRFRLSEKFASMLFDSYKKASCAYNYDITLRLDSVLGIRLYDFLRLHTRKKILLPATQLRCLFGLLDTNENGGLIIARQRSFANLILDTLAPAIREINEKTDLTVSYRVIRSSSHAPEASITIELSCKFNNKKSGFSIIPKKTLRQKIKLVPLSYSPFTGNKVPKQRASKAPSSSVDKSSGSYITNRLRLAILARDNYHCVKCGRGPEDGVKLHVDHIVPSCKGGKTVPENLQTLCETCNWGKGGRYEDELAVYPGISLPEKENASTI